MKLIIALSLNIYLGLALAGLYLLSAKGQKLLEVLEPSQSIQQLPDFRQYTDSNEKKNAFFAFMKPLIDEENLRQKRSRETLLRLREKAAEAKKIRAREKRNLLRLSKQYNLPVKKQSLFKDRESLLQHIDRLLLRANVIPTDLALAQAAIESGWGTSRFAREANNIFGQWCYTKGCGVVPKKRNAGARHEVKKFASVSRAVQSYFKNINTHRAYKALRKKRQAISESGKEITSADLLPHLVSYSEIGQAYVTKVTNIISRNNL